MLMYMRYFSSTPDIYYRFVVSHPCITHEIEYYKDRSFSLFTLSHKIPAPYYLIIIYMFYNISNRKHILK